MCDVTAVVFVINSDPSMCAALEDLLVADLARVGARLGDEVVDDLLGHG